MTILHLLLVHAISLRVELSASRFAFIGFKISIREHSSPKHQSDLHIKLRFCSNYVFDVWTSFSTQNRTWRFEDGQSKRTMCFHNVRDQRKAYCLMGGRRSLHQCHEHQDVDCKLDYSTIPKRRTPWGQNRRENDIRRWNREWYLQHGLNRALIYVDETCFNI